MITIDFNALLFIVPIILPFFLWKIDKKQPRIPYSSLERLKKPQKTLREKSILLLPYLFWSGIAFLLLAFLNPEIQIAEKQQKTILPPPPSEGIAIYFLLDRSGSMNEEIDASKPGEGRFIISKIDLLKTVTEKFINGDKKHELSGRPNDLIGLVAFARFPEILSPLTLDHEAILKKLKELQTVKTEEMDGTAMGYAIYKTSHLIAALETLAKQTKENQSPYYTIKSKAMIVVTDGFQDPNYLDRGNALRTIELEPAAKYAKEQGIHLYIIDIDPKMGSEQFAPQRRQLTRITEMTGGKYYLVGGSLNLHDIYSSIDRLEKGSTSSLQNKQLFKIYKQLSLWPYLISLGMFCLAIGFILKTTYLRLIP